MAWNLVEGIHDAPEASERTVWVAGEPREVPPVAFDGLRGVGGLRFEPVATRAQRENYLLIRSDYEQPFGTFSGELPGRRPAARGLGRDGAPRRALVGNRRTAAGVALV